MSERKKVRSELEKRFGEQCKPDREMKEKIAGELGMNFKQINTWFQNRRAKEKMKEKETKLLGLKKDLEKLKAEHEALRARNEEIQAELMVVEMMRSPVEISYVVPTETMVPEETVVSMDFFQDSDDWP